MSKLRLSDHARDDLSDIWVYIAQDNPAAADTFVATLLEKMDLLARSPRLGRKRDELRPGIRSFPVGNYVIFYRRAGRGIEVVRLLSGFRDIASEF